MTSVNVVPIAAGEDLLAGLVSATSTNTQGWVQATGHVEAVEIKLAGEVTDPTRALRGRFTLVSLQGPAGGPFTATLARASDTGLELVGGVLIKGRSAGVSVAVFGAAGAASAPTPGREDATERSERATERRVVAATPATPEKAGQPAWASVVAASEEAEERAAIDEAEAVPRRGDLVDHFAFGLCEVIMEEGDRLKIRDIKGPGRVREIVPEMLNLKGPTKHESGKRLFKLMKRS